MEVFHEEEGGGKICFDESFHHVNTLYEDFDVYLYRELVEICGITLKMV